MVECYYNAIDWIKLYGRVLLQCNFYFLLFSLTAITWAWSFNTLFVQYSKERSAAPQTTLWRGPGPRFEPGTGGSIGRDTDHQTTTPHFQTTTPHKLDHHMHLTNQTTTCTSQTRPPPLTNQTTTCTLPLDHPTSPLDHHMHLTNNFYLESMFRVLAGTDLLGLDYFHITL